MRHMSNDTLADPTLADPTLDITDDDFWSHLHVPADENGRAVEILTDALRLGRSDQSDDAYRALAKYHRLARGDSWGRARKLAASAKPISGAAKRVPAPAAGRITDIMAICGVR